MTTHVYTKAQFRRRFRMRRHVFLRIVEALGNHDEHFQRRIDVVGRMGLSPLQKCTAALRILAYGSPTDIVDDYVHIGENVTLECLDRGDPGKPTIMLEVVASQDFGFGIAGSNNDINVLNTFDMFNDVLNGKAHAVQYTVKHTSYHMGYYLEDDSYPERATFVKTIPMLQGEKIKLFFQRQESAQKDVERAFGVLQARFAIVRCPSRAWHVNTMKHIMLTCIILHNMIVEDKRDTYAGNFDYNHVDNNFSTTEVSTCPDPNLTTLFERITHVHQRQNHCQLQADFVEHIWERFGHENNES